MTPELTQSVDRYLCDLFAAPDDALAAALATSAAAGLPDIQVAPNQGKLLHMLARMIGARRILEIGTLGGYSAIWMARALPPEGRLVTLELEAAHARVAQENFARAGVAGRIELREGDAMHSLDRLRAEQAGPFDLTFIDADKARTPEYFARSLELSRRGSVIVLDNAIRRGEIVNAGSEDPGARGIRLVLEQMSRHPRVTASALQTVGSKGYDGFAVALVTADEAPADASARGT